jgi:TrkA domain protein
VTASHPRHLRIDEARLPGIGLRHDFRTEHGRHVGLVTYRSGRRELLLYSGRDDDEAAEVVVLTEDEAAALAGLLGASEIVAHLHDAVSDVPGIIVSRIDVDVASPFAGRPLGDTRARTRTGASIVAILRGAEVAAAPGPASLLAGGDVLVVVGTPRGVEHLTEIIRG